MGPLATNALHLRSSNKTRGGYLKLPCPRGTKHLKGIVQRGKKNKISNNHQRFRFSSRFMIRIKEINL